MKMFPHQLNRVTNQHSQRTEKLIKRLEVERERLHALANANLSDNPELSARLHSLLLYAEGKPLHEIKAITGLSISAVLRVRRRFECWGLSCVMDASPLLIAHRKTSSRPIVQPPGIMDRVHSRMPSAQK